MGRSKKSNQTDAGRSKLFCYWCDKEFAEEDKLIQHQVAKHFQCPECRTGQAGKCINLECLVVHYNKVHKTQLLKTPNAKEGRDDPMASQYIYGMSNVPEAVMEGWQMDSADIQKILNPPAPATTEESIRHGMMAREVQVKPPQSFPEFAAPLIARAPQSAPAPAVGSTDWSSQVKQWMTLIQPAKDRIAAAKATAPPLPESAAPILPGNGYWAPPQPATAAPSTKQFGTELPGSSQSFQGFNLGSAPSAALRVDAAASDAIAAFAERARLASAAAGPVAAPAVSSGTPTGNWSLFRGEKPAPVAQSHFPASTYGAVPPPGYAAAPEPQMTPSRRSRSRSRSRRRRSGSRGRGRSRSRSRRDGRPKDSRPYGRPAENRPTFGPASGGHSGPADNSQNRTIQIIEGEVTSRLKLKGEMEKFGRVETVYMGNRHEVSSDPPMVRFALAAHAEMALNTINSGQVCFDGVPIRAQFKTGGGRPPPQRVIEREADKVHITSREFAQSDRRRDDRRDDRREDRRYDDRRHDDRRYDDRRR